MKKHSLLLLLILLIFSATIALAQNTHQHFPPSKNDKSFESGTFYAAKSVTITPEYFLAEMNYVSVKNYLMSSLPELQTQGAGLKLIYNKASKGGNHFTYQQTLNDIPVFGTTVKVNTDNKNHIISILNASLNLASVDQPIIQAQVSKLNNDKIISNFILKNYDTDALFGYEINICFTEVLKSIAIQKIKVWNRSTGLNELTLVDETGNIIYQKDLNLYYYGVAMDSLIHVKVFNPDPLTLAGVTYGTPYKDYNDGDSSVLNIERIDTSVVATYNNGTFSLTNDYVSILDFESPNKPVVTQTNPDFFYTRHDDGFEDVNCFYHITTMQNYIQSAGYTNMMNQLLELDSHAVQGADNSYFNAAGGQPQISMGEGGVDDAEDADVIVHEYGHALSWSANNNNFNSNDRGALDEAFGDYQAATYSRGINPYHWEEIFTWDGFNEFWAGRYANSTKIYPQDLIGDVHEDGEIWSSVMMEIWGWLGKSTTDKLMYESLYSWSDNMSMPDAAMLVIQADSLLNGGANYNVLCDRFTARGLYSGNCSLSVNEINNSNNDIKVLNSSAFASGAGDLSIIFSSTEKEINIEVNDMIGQNIQQLSFHNTNRIDFSPFRLSKGMYTLLVKTSAQQNTAKIIRIN